MPLVLPRRPLSLRGLGLPCTSKNNTVLGPIAAHHITGPHSSKVPGERGSSQPPLATMHDLLEWQWDQAGSLLLQQAEGTDGEFTFLTVIQQESETKTFAYLIDMLISTLL